MTSHDLPPRFSGYAAVPQETARGAGRRWWDENAREYLREHGEFLADDDFLWCPEGLRESSAALLGPVADLAGKQVLEVGCGGAQCSRWLRAQGVEATALDVSQGMLDEATRLNTATGIEVPLVLGDARDLPFAAQSFDVVFTAYGALPFVAEDDVVHAEVARILRPGGRWVFSITHPFRWAFPDAPGVAGLSVTKSYFDRTPYVETDDAGRVNYAEYHRTIGDHVRALATAGFYLEDIVEPEWPDGHDREWGGWSPLRGRVLPGTAIFRARLLMP